MPPGDVTSRYHVTMLLQSNNDDDNQSQDMSARCALDVPNMITLFANALCLTVTLHHHLMPNMYGCRDSSWWLPSRHSWLVHEVWPNSLGTLLLVTPTADHGTTGNVTLQIIWSKRMWRSTFQQAPEPQCSIRLGAGCMYSFCQHQI